MPYKDPQKRKEFMKSYYQSNKEVILEATKKRYLEKSESIKAYSKIYYQKNRERLLVVNKKWRENNKETYAASVKFFTAKRRAAIKSNKAINSDYSDMKPFYLLAERLSEQTGVKYVVDHIKPISKGGLHHKDNLQVITLAENSKKGSKYPYEVKEHFNPSPDFITIV